MANLGQSGSIHLVAFVAIPQIIQTMSMICKKMGEMEWENGVAARKVERQESRQREKANREKDKQFKKYKTCKRIQQGDVALKIKTI